MHSAATIHTVSPLDKDLTALGEVYVAASSELPNAEAKETEPRLPLPEQYEAQGLRLGHMLSHGVIGWKAIADDGRIVGVIFLNQPGWRNESVTQEEATGTTFKGYNMQYHDSVIDDMQGARDQSMGNQPYWYIRILAVHPSYQRRGIGSQLMNTALAYILGSAHPELPILAKPTSAAEAIYRAFAFEYKAPGKYQAGIPDGKVWVKDGVNH